MARKHGRNATMYISLDGTAAPSPVAFLSTFSVDQTTDKVEVTSLGDVTKAYVSGLPDFKGTFSGFYDAGTGSTGSDAIYRAASDGIARPFYLYLDSTTPTTDYFYGTALFDFSTGAGVGAAVTLSGNFQAAGGVYFKYT